MREGRVATVETSNSAELTAIKSQMDMLGKQFNAFMQHVNSQTVNYTPPMSVMSQPVVNTVPVYTPAAVKPVQ